MSSEPRGLSRYATIFFVTCFLLIGYFLFLVFRPFFTILVWASVLTVVFWPLFRELLRFSRGRRTLSALITCLIIFLLIVLPVTLIGVVVTQQSISIYQAIQSNLEGERSAAYGLQELQKRPAVAWVLSQTSRLLGTEKVDLGDAVRQVLGAISRWIVARGPSVLRGVGELLFSFFLIFITMFFLFRDGPALVANVKASNPLPAAYESEIIQKFQDVSYATFYGSLLTAIVQGCAAALLFWILGIASPLFWGAVVAFMSLVPIVGAFLVWFPMSAYLFFSDQATQAILLLALGGLVVSSIDNVMKPMIIQGRTNMHPLLVFLSVLGGMNVFGFLGILLGPLLGAIFLSFLNFYRLEYGEALRLK
jgi:predicted PurR-regulated permease PerM